jgi:hypothetical protein
MSQSIFVDERQINWRVISGLVIDLQKYTKTSVSGSISTTRMIVELLIQQDNGDRIKVVLTSSYNSPSLAGLRIEQYLAGTRRVDEAFVEGMCANIFLYGVDIPIHYEQNISLLQGYTTSRESDWLLLINHEDKQWCWLVKPRLFFESLGILVTPKEWYHALLFLVVLSFLFILVSTSLRFEFITWFPICILLLFVGMILIESIQNYRSWQMWWKIRSRLVEIVRSLT